MRLRLTFYFPVLLLLLCGGCKGNLPLAKPEQLNYFFLSHTRNPDDNYSMDSLAAQIPAERFDMTWLGGDMMNHTSLEPAYLRYLDSLYDLKSPNTLLAPGNHDLDNRGLFSTWTGKDLFYTHHSRGITFLVLNTQQAAYQFVGPQLDMIRDVCDTLSQSSHLIVLHHKLVWLVGDSALEAQANSLSNGPLGSCYYCLNPTNFYTEVYPELLKVKQRGKEVWCIGGDMGYNADHFEYRTEDDILFLGNGIGAKQNSTNEAIIFRHYPERDSMVYEFRRLHFLTKMWGL